MTWDQFQNIKYYAECYSNHFEISPQKIFEFFIFLTRQCKIKFHINMHSADCLKTIILTLKILTAKVNNNLNYFFVRVRV